MRGVLASAALVILCAAAAAAADAPLGYPIDLNAAGALEALERSNPAHYATIRKIMEGILHQPDAEVPRWIRVTFGGQGVGYPPIVMTSYPPKRRLWFSLDGTRYQAVVTLTNVSGEIAPAR